MVSKKEKLVSCPIVIIVKVKSQKAKVVDLTPEVVNLIKIKLKTPTKKPDLKEPTQIRLPQ